MKIAVTGSLDGKLNDVYDELLKKEKEKKFKIDLVLVAGNFQAVRNKNDLICMDCLDCWKNLGDFHDYYTGKRKATHLTLVISGDQEATNYFRTLPYGGWIAPKIYFMGNSNVIKFNGLRIGAISGVFDKFYEHFFKTDITKTGYFEQLPFDQRDKRSVCYTRYLDVYRFLQIKNDLDIMFTFDWPLDVLDNKQDKIDCLKKVPFSMQNGDLFNDLGSPMFKQILDQVKPKHWFSGKIRLTMDKAYQHQSTNKTTQFHSIEKYIANRKGLQIFDFNNENSTNTGLQYDLEWLAILKVTNQFVNISREPKDLPIDLIELTPDLMESIDGLMKNDFKIPKNFAKCPPVFWLDKNPKRDQNYVNKQTTTFTRLLKLTDPNRLIIDTIKDVSNDSNSKKDHHKKYMSRLSDWFSNIVCNKI